MARSRRRRSRAVATHGTKEDVTDNPVTRRYTTRRRVPQISFKHWCAVAVWGQTNLDPDIVSWILRLMSEREAAGINTISYFQNWIELHKPAFSWTTELEWERVTLSARAMWIAYCELLDNCNQQERGS
jgi:hypothetical protein